MKPIIIFFIVLLLLLFSSVSNCYADGDSNRIELFEPDELDHVVGIHAGLGIHFFGNSTVNVYNYDSGTFEDVNINWNDVFERTFRPGITLGRCFYGSELWMFLDISRHTWNVEQQVEIENIGIFELEGNPTINMWEYSLSFRYFVAPKKYSPFGFHFGPYVTLHTEGLFGGAGFFSGGAMGGIHYAPFFFGENDRPIILNLDVSGDLFSGDKGPRVLDISMSILIGFMK